MKFKAWRKLSRAVLHGGLAAVAATFLYIYFYADAAVESGRLSRLSLVPSMLEHAVVALCLLVAGVYLFDRLVSRDKEK